MEDERVISDLNIQEELTLHLVLKMQIFVKIWPSQSEPFTLEVEPTDTSVAVKARIQNKKGIAFDKQMLNFKKNQLEHGKTLSDYNIKEGSTVMLEHGMRIFLNGRTPLTFMVEASTKIKDFKAVMQLK